MVKANRKVQCKTSISANYQCCPYSTRNTGWACSWRGWSWRGSRYSHPLPHCPLAPESSGLLGFSVTYGWVSLTFPWFALGLTVTWEISDMVVSMECLWFLGVVVNFISVPDHLPSEEKLGLFLAQQQHFLWEGHRIPQPSSCPMLPAHY